MFVSFARLWRDREGVSAVEFALMLPVLLLITAGMIDLGRALYQTNVIEKGLRAGAMYAARNDFPLTTSQQTEAQNIVKKGNRDGAGSYLVSGWSDSTSLSIFTTTEIVDGTPLPHESLVSVHRGVRKLAAVPFSDGFTMMWYRDGGDGQGFHRDDDLKWTEDTRIAILTLGAERPWYLRPRSHRNQHGLENKGATHDLKPASGDLLVMGSTVLVQSLIDHGLVDELRLVIDPVLVGGGKRIFPEDGAMRTLRLVDHEVTSNGTIIAAYAPA